MKFHKIMAILPANKNRTDVKIISRESSKKAREKEMKKCLGRSILVHILSYDREWSTSLSNLKIAI